MPLVNLGSNLASYLLCIGSSKLNQHKKD